MKEVVYKASRLKAFNSVVSTSEKFNLRPTPLTSRDLAIEELEFCLADVENYILAIRPASCPSGYKKLLKKLINLLTSALTSIQKKRTPLKEIKALMANEVIDTVNVLTEMAEKASSEDTELTPEQVEASESVHIKSLKSKLILEFCTVVFVLGFIVYTAPVDIVASGKSSNNISLVNNDVVKLIGMSCPAAFIISYPSV